MTTNYKLKEIYNYLFNQGIEDIDSVSIFNDGN